MSGDSSIPLNPRWMWGRQRVEERVLPSCLLVVLRQPSAGHSLVGWGLHNCSVAYVLLSWAWLHPAGQMLWVCATCTELLALMEWVHEMEASTADREKLRGTEICRQNLLRCAQHVLLLIAPLLSRRMEKGKHLPGKERNTQHPFFRCWRNYADAGFSKLLVAEGLIIRNSRNWVCDKQWWQSCRSHGQYRTQCILVPTRFGKVQMHKSRLMTLLIKFRALASSAG